MTIVSDFDGYDGQIEDDDYLPITPLDSSGPTSSFQNLLTTTPQTSTQQNTLPATCILAATQLPSTSQLGCTSTSTSIATIQQPTTSTSLATALTITTTIATSKYISL